jgi:RES domain-containing protein
MTKTKDSAERITAWRIVAARQKQKAFSGEGARLNGGRWNSKGVAMVYTAGNLALASLEMVVNLPSPALLQEFVRIPIQFELQLVQILPDTELPRDWNSRPISPSTRAVGDRWVKERRSAVLRVPSVVVPEEYNYLLNPAHPDFVRICIDQTEIYHFDPRLAVRF